MTCLLFYQAMHVGFATISCVYIYIYIYPSLFSIIGASKCICFQLDMHNGNLGFASIIYLFIYYYFFLWKDYNLTLYNHSKNRLVWCDVESHKRFEYIFLITN